MDVSIFPLGASRLQDLGALFASTEASDHCRCMWFIKSVKSYHADGATGNWADFKRLAENGNQQLGLIAYVADEPKGWCALGTQITLC